MMRSVRAALSGRRLLVTGASGFLGKVWLAHLLCEVPDLAEVTLVLRPGRKGSARRRLEDLLATSPAFWPLHERYGPEVGAVLGKVLRPVAGDLGEPRLGLSQAERERLGGRVDLVINLGGMTALDPDLEQALAVNTRGALEALEVARELGAALLHVSTAYVAGRRLGTVPEVLEADAVPCPPAGSTFRARQELDDLTARIHETRRRADDQRVQAELARRAREQAQRHGATAAQGEAFLARERAAWIDEELQVLARERARAWGWPNAYTLSKSLAESLLLEERGDVPLWVARPTIVESALAFPFPGWKEGLQTSGPLTYALTHGPLRALPARERLVLDVIPVDFVARGLCLLSAGLLEAPADAAPRAFHIGSSQDHPLPMERVLELTALAHRRASPAGTSLLRRLLTPDAAASSERTYRWTSLPALRRLAKEGGELCGLLSDGLPGDLAERSRRLGRRLDRAERKLGDLEQVVERFLPFVLENDCVFAAQGLRDLEGNLPPEERAAFAADPRGLDWRSYWMEVHVPGLRRWVYPRLEGKRLPRTERRPVDLAVQQVGPEVDG